jgi:DNA-binding MarR family transcriptional regulator
VTRRSTAADAPAPDVSGHRRSDLTGLDQAGRVWAVLRDLAESYPPRHEVRAALKLGRGSGRVKALLRLTEGPLSLTELADACQVDAPYATLIVDSLEQRGLVERRPDPADRRRRLVALTAAGEEKARDARSILDQPPPGFARLSPAELDVLEDLVARIADAPRP